MNIITFGCAIPRTSSRSMSGAGLIITPGQMLNEMNNVEAGVKALDLDVQTQAEKIPSAWKSQWEGFKTEWRNFYKENEGFFARTWGGLMDQILDYKNRLVAWRASFEKAGGSAVGPGPKAPENGFPWTLALIVGGVSVAAITGAVIVSKWKK